MANIEPHITSYYGFHNRTNEKLLLGNTIQKIFVFDFDKTLTSFKTYSQTGKTNIDLDKVNIDLNKKYFNEIQEGKVLRLFEYLAKQQCLIVILTQGHRDSIAEYLENVYQNIYQYIYMIVGANEISVHNGNEANDDDLFYANWKTHKLINIINFIYVEKSNYSFDGNGYNIPPLNPPIVFFDDNPINTLVARMRGINAYTVKYDENSHVSNVNEIARQVFKDFNLTYKELNHALHDKVVDDISSEYITNYVKYCRNSTNIYLNTELEQPLEHLRVEESSAKYSKYLKYKQKYLMLKNNFFTS
jgi:hypothetical protein